MHTGRVATTRRAVGTLLAALAATALSAGAPASAEPVDECAVAASWAERIIASTDATLPPGWSVVLDCDPDAIWTGVTYPDDREITIWLTHFDDAGHLVALWLHELGHAYDVAVLDDRARDFWRVHRGIDPDVPWVDHTPLDERDTSKWGNEPSEDFAESFAYCIDPDDTHWWEPMGNEPPTAAQCRVMEQLTGVPMPHGAE